MSRLSPLSIAVTLLLGACAPEDGVVGGGGELWERAVRLDPPAGAGAMAPNLSSGRDGTLLTWLEPAEDGHVLRLAELRAERWGEPQTIARGGDFFANWADLPMAVEAADGTRFAHWLEKLGDDTYAYGAALARSDDGGQSWRRRGLLHDDDSPTEHGFVSYTTEEDGAVRAFWLDGRAMLDGGGMQLRTARLGDAGPSVSELLDERVCECCSTDAARTENGPVVVYRDRSETEVRDIGIIRATTDGWSEPTLVHTDGWRIEGCPVNGPAVAADGQRVAVAWFSAPDARARALVAFSNDGGATFAEPVPVDEAQPLGRVDLVLDRDGAALVSWLGSSADGAEIRWRRVAADGTRGPLRATASTSAGRSAGVPRMVLHDGQLLVAWVEASDPSRLRASLVPLD